MEGLDLMSVISWRAVERLLSVFIGGISIYLGYRLFLRIPNLPRDGEGKIELPGGISVYITRIGPGVFFSLFGAALIAFSLNNPLSMTSGRSGVADTGAGVDSKGLETAFSYVGGKTTVAAFSGERSRVLGDIRGLEALSRAIDSGDQARLLEFIAAGSADRFLIALPRIKRQLLFTVWDDSWGDYAAFADWVRSGEQDPIPAGMDRIIRLYRGDE